LVITSITTTISSHRSVSIPITTWRASAAATSTAASSSATTAFRTFVLPTDCNIWLKNQSSFLDEEQSQVSNHEASLIKF